MSTSVRHHFDPSLDAQLCATSAPRRALFLDRDGVINVDHGYVHNAAATQWVAGIFDLCAAARQAGYLLVVVTNQAGIARGYYTEQVFVDYTRWMHEEFARRGVPLAATYYCPHHPTEGRGSMRIACLCRKPEPGMILSALEQLELDPTRSVLVGDKYSDVAAGAIAGIAKNILFDEKGEISGNGNEILDSVSNLSQIALYLGAVGRITGSACDV